MRVGTLKYTEHDGFDWDTPGKDTYRHREAGSMATGIFGSRIFAFSLNQEKYILAPHLDLIRIFYQSIDLVLVEGYRRGAGQKIEVCRPGYSDRSIAPPDDLLATYGENLFDYSRPHFNYGNEALLAAHIASNIHCLEEV
jgi:molybdopterin-guanine dinucleotide biosynthesis protein B